MLKKNAICQNKVKKRMLFVETRLKKNAILIALLYCYRSKLENSIEQWQDYDGQYENLAQWLKETEAKMRSESSLRPDLDGKVEQKERLKVKQS